MNRRELLQNLAGLVGTLGLGTLDRSLAPAAPRREPQPTTGLAFARQQARWWAEQYVRQAWGADTINAVTGEPVNPNSAFSPAIGHLLNQARILGDQRLQERCLDYLATHDARKATWAPPPMKGICGEHISFCTDVYWLAYEISGEEAFRQKALTMAGEYLERAFEEEYEVVQFSYDFHTGRAEGDQYLNHAAHLIGTLTRLDEEFIRSCCRRLAAHIMNHLSPIGWPYQLYRASRDPLPAADIYGPGVRPQRAAQMGEGYPEIWAEHPITRQDMITDFLEALCLAHEVTGEVAYRRSAEQVLDSFLRYSYEPQEGKLYLVDVETGERLPNRVQFQHLCTCLLIRSLCMLGQVSVAEEFAARLREYGRENGLYVEWSWLGWGRSQRCNLALEPATALLYLYAHTGKELYLTWIDEYLESLVQHAKRAYGFAQIRTDNLAIERPDDCHIFGGGIAPAFVLPHLLPPKQTRGLPDMFELYHQPLPPAKQS